MSVGDRGSLCFADTALRSGSACRSGPGARLPSARPVGAPWAWTQARPLGPAVMLECPGSRHCPRGGSPRPGKLRAPVSPGHSDPTGRRGGRAFGVPGRCCHRQGQADSEGAVHRPLPLLSYFTTCCGFFLQASPSGPGETGPPGRLGRGLRGGHQGRGAASAFSAPRAPDGLRADPSWLCGELAGRISG